MLRTSSVCFDAPVADLMSRATALRPFRHETESAPTAIWLELPVALGRTARSVHPEPTLLDGLARVKYFVRGLATPRITAQWFAILAAPELETLVQNNPHIMSKLQRPYLQRRLTVTGRIAALQNHYAFMNERVDEKARRQIYSSAGLLLAELPMTDGANFTIRLGYRNQFEKEGELTIGLFDDADRAMFSLTFCVHEFNSRQTGLFVGGLQGHQFENQRDVVVAFTRAMHGLRPKALLVFVLQRLAQLWSCERVVAVGDGEHIYRHIRKRKTVNAAYDEFWTECLGQALPDGNFALPPMPQCRDISELPSNKRPVYRRRYAMLAQLGEVIRERLAVGLAAQIPTSATKICEVV